ncbi:MAG: DNA repair protein RecO [Candidatus Pacebacteria bacterium]|nr:DNA repair protein RecO [Candidatus Paceibacterota bacterium]
MAYHTYKTEGIVLSIKESGEASSYITVFTKELGLIKANVQGTRLLKSKLKYAIQKYNVSKMSFVYGKSNWKLTGAVPLYNIYYELKDSKQKLEIVANTFSLLLKLLAGEDKNEELFNLISGGIDFIKTNNLSKEEISYFEFLFVLRILSNLGYISTSNKLESLAFGSGWNSEIVKELSEYKKEAVEAINRALLESQLY